MRLILNLLIKIVKGFLAVVKELIEQSWTLIGMFVAWIVLTGSAKSVVGTVIVLNLIVWMVTLWWRRPKD